VNVCCFLFIMNNREGDLKNHVVLKHTPATTITTTTTTTT